MKHARRKKPQSAASLGGFNALTGLTAEPNDGVAGAKRNRYRKRSKAGKAQCDKNEKKNARKLSSAGILRGFKLGFFFLPLEVLCA